MRAWYYCILLYCTRAPGLPAKTLFHCRCVRIIYIFIGFCENCYFICPSAEHNTTNPLENYVTQRIRRRRRRRPAHVQPITPVRVGNVSHRLQKTFRTMCSRKCVYSFQYLSPHKRDEERGRARTHAHTRRAHAHYIRVFSLCVRAFWRYYRFITRVTVSI